MREDRVRDVDGVAVREWGEEGAPTAAFCHGLGPLASGAFGRELAPALVECGWRLLAHDLIADRGPEVGELVADWLAARA